MTLMNPPTHTALPFTATQVKAGASTVPADGYTYPQGVKRKGRG